MSQSPPPRSGGPKPGAVRRQAMTFSQQQLIATSTLPHGTPLPLVVEPAHADVDLVSWAQANRAFVEDTLWTHGGILFRGFGITTADGLERLAAAIAGELLEYRDRATPRSQVQGNVYTSTDYPADQSIELHNESSYAYAWPLKILFCCSIPAQQGGETPIADSRRVFERIPRDVRDRFIEKRLVYVRNFGEYLGTSWQDAFQTNDRAAVEAFCRQNRIECAWLGEDRLRTRQVRPAVLRHQRTGEMVWFNQATAFHQSTLDPEVLETLLREFRPDELPKNVFFADGAPIDDADLAAIRAAYRQETIAFPWRQGDVLLLDNLLVAHGRAPFVGPRKVLVAMAETGCWQDI